jgi:hypothetical protein
MRWALCVALLAAVWSVGGSALPADKPPLSRAEAKDAVARVQSALELERKARDGILANTYATLSPAADDLTQARFELYQVESDLSDHSFGGANPIPALHSARSTDGGAEADLREQMSGKNFGNPLPSTFRDRLVKEIGAAITVKKRALSLLYVVVTLTDVPPTNAGSTCTVEKPFQVFAIPAGFSGSYADVYPHGIPKGAKNVKASFIDLATGKAPGPDVFPGQTWTSTVKGYQPDGKFDVHVDVTGTGFGKPNANVKNWKVVVTYDCP